MAASWTCLPWRILKRNQLEYKQLLVFSCTNRFSQCKQFSAQQKQAKPSDQLVRNFLTYTFLFSGVGYILYKWKNDLNLFDSIKNFIPTIHAKSITTEDINHNRDKYNFIADVVEISAPSVVYIEIKDNKR